MATFDYNKSRALAARLINKFGTVQVLTKKGIAPGRDPATGKPTAGTQDTFINGEISPLLDYDSNMQGAYETNGSMIQTGDKFAFYHSGSEVEIGMVFNMDSFNWRVQSIVGLDGAGVSVYRKLQLRR